MNESLESVSGLEYMPAMARDHTSGLPMMKMQGLGNDFVVLDTRVQPVDMTAELARAIGDRRRGVGFDQLAILSPSEDSDGFLEFYNSDGSMSSTCGNATRCIARMLLDETGRDALVLTTPHGALPVREAGNGLTSVNMGHPQLNWQDIPLAEAMDTLELPIEGAPSATSMGNPHCTFFVDDAEAIDLERFGAEHEHHPLYPERTNVQVAHLIGPDHIRMRVWERGVGITLASGSSSCATAVTAARKGLAGRKVQIDLDGGTLHIDWAEDGVWMTGPTLHVFTGTLTPEFLAKI